MCSVQTTPPLCLQWRHMSWTELCSLKSERWSSNSSETVFEGSTLHPPQPHFFPTDAVSVILVIKYRHLHIQEHGDVPMLASTSQWWYLMRDSWLESKEGAFQGWPEAMVRKMEVIWGPHSCPHLCLTAMVMMVVGLMLSHRPAKYVLPSFSRTCSQALLDNRRQLLKALWTYWRWQVPETFSFNILCVTGHRLPLKEISRGY